MKKWGWVVVACICLLLALVWTFPLVARMDSSIPYSLIPEPELKMVYFHHGDHLQLYYRLWQFYDSLKQGRLFTPVQYEFAGSFHQKIFSGQFMPLSFIYALFAPLDGVLAYNILLLLTFPLTGVATYLLIRVYGAGFMAGLTGAVVATFLPYRLGQLAGGHPNGFIFFVIPLLLWLIEKYLRSGRTYVAGLAGLALLSQMIMELHAAYFTFILIAVYLPVRWLLPLERWLTVKTSYAHRWPGTSPWIPMLISPAAVALFRMAHLRVSMVPPPGWPVTLVSGIFWGLAVLFLYGAASSILSAVFSLEKEASAGLLAPVFMPLVLLPLYAVKLIAPIPYLGKGLFAVTFILVAMAAQRAVLMLLKSRPVSFRLSRIFTGRAGGIIPLAISIVLSLCWVFYLRYVRFVGTSLEGGRSTAETLLFTAPLESAFRRTVTTTEFYLYPGFVCVAVILAVLLPGFRAGSGRKHGESRQVWFFGIVAGLAYLLSFGERGDVVFPLHAIAVRLVPYMGFIRVPSRAMILFTPAFAVFVGYACERLLVPVRKRGMAILVGTFLVAAILGDFWSASRIGLTELPKSNAVYEEKLEGPGTRLAEVPIWPGDSDWSSMYQYWITRYRHEIINGYSPLVPPDYYQEVFSPLIVLNVGYLGAGEASLLRELGVGRLVLHKEAFPPQVSLFPFALTLEGLKSSPYLRYVMSDDPLWLFQVLDAPRDTAYGSVAPTSPMGVVFQAEDRSMNPRNIVKTDHGTAAVGEGRGKAVISGPRRLFPAGRFRVKVRMGPGGGGAGQGAAMLRLLDNEGLELGGKVFTLDTAGEEDMSFYPFEFELERPRRLVFEVVSEGDEPVAVDYLYIVHADQHDPPGLIEYEELRSLGRVVEDPAAGGGRAVVFDPMKDPRLAFSAGPLRYLPPGSWKVGIRYRAEGGRETAGSVALEESGGPVLGRVDLVSGLDGRRGYRSASSVLHLERGVLLDLKMTYQGSSELYIDKLELERN